MNVTILSCFRNATAHIPLYFDQIDHLANVLARRKPYTSLSLILGYGDSTDGTGEALFEAAADSIGALLVDVSHGGAHYGSIEHPTRFKQLAYVGNKLFGCIPNDADAVALIESDLIWDAVTIVQLIDDLEHLPPPFGAVAPMVMDGANSFYDVFAFRRKGQRFTKEPPYHADLNPGDDLVEIESAGSVLVMDGDLARRVCFPDEDVVVGLCRKVHEQGGSVWLDTTLTVTHG